MLNCSEDDTIYLLRILAYLRVCSDRSVLVTLGGFIFSVISNSNLKLNYKMGGVSNISGTLASVSGAFPTFAVQFIVFPILKKLISYSSSTVLCLCICKAFVL